MSLKLARSVSSCVATIRPKSGVKPTCRDSSTDAIDPERKSRSQIWCAAMRPLPGLEPLGLR